MGAEAVSGQHQSRDCSTRATVWSITLPVLAHENGLSILPMTDAPNEPADTAERRDLDQQNHDAAHIGYGDKGCALHAHHLARFNLLICASNFGPIRLA